MILTQTQGGPKASNKRSLTLSGERRQHREFCEQRTAAREATVPNCRQAMGFIWLTVDRLGQLVLDVFKGVVMSMFIYP